MIALALLPIALPAQQPTFKSGVDVVLIDVNVVDGTGRPVGDLKPDDFQVSVDKKPRRILSAQFLRYQVYGAAMPSSTVVKMFGPAGPEPPPPPRNILIVIDEDSLEPGQGIDVRKAAEKFLERLAPEDRVGVATIPRLRSTLVLTTKRSEVRKALAAVNAGTPPENPTTLNVGLSEVLDFERGDGDAMARIVARECVDDPGWRSATAGANGTPSVAAAGASGGCKGLPVDLSAFLHQMAAQVHLRGRRSVDALRDLGGSLAQLPGPKTVILVSGGMPPPDVYEGTAYAALGAGLAAGQVTLHTIYLKREQYGQAKSRQASPTSEEDMRLERHSLENVIGVAGGTFTDGVGKLDRHFDRVAVAISGSYLLGMEVAPGDRDGRSHQVDVRLNRKGVDVLARKQYVIPREAVEKAAVVSDGDVRPAPRPAKPSPAVVWVMTPDVQAVVARATEYATAYEADASALVAEERYEQKTYSSERRQMADIPSARTQMAAVLQSVDAWVVDETRVLKSDYLLVRAPGGGDLVPFRDVFEVDGKKVREREARLQKLFLEAPAAAESRAAAIVAESARYNIGFVERNLNLPTLALRFLASANRERAVFRKQGESEVAHARAWEIAFEERQSPTLLRANGGDMRAAGVFWVDPASGRVLRTLLRLTPPGGTVEITVTYAADSKAGQALVPVEMREAYVGAGRKIECLATYSKIRRFQVTTETQIPK